MSSTFANPLEALLQARREKKATAEQHERELAEQKRQEHEAAEAERRAAAKQQYLEREVREFANGFLFAVAKHAASHDWSIKAIEDANSYASVLLTTTDKELPRIDVGIMKVVRSKFAFGLALNKSKMRNVWERQYFLGMRQDWFADALAKAEDDVIRFNRNRSH